MLPSLQVSMYSFKFTYLFLAALGLHCSVVSCCGAWAVGTWASVVVMHRLSCSAVCGIFPDQKLNPCPLHWQVNHLITREVPRHNESLIRKAHHCLGPWDKCSRSTSFCRPLVSVVHLSPDVLRLVHIFSGVLDDGTWTKREGNTKTSHQKFCVSKTVLKLLVEC